MSRKTLYLIIALIVALVVLMMYLILVYLPSQKVSSQALQVSSVTTSSQSVSYTTYSTVPLPSQPSTPVLPVSSSSYLSNYLQMQMTLLNTLTVGDTVWLILQLPYGGVVTEAMDIVTANQLGIGTTITPGTTLTPVLA